MAVITQRPGPTSVSTLPDTVQVGTVLDENAIDPVTVDVALIVRGSLIKLSAKPGKEPPLNVIVKLAVLNAINVMEDVITENV